MSEANGTGGLSIGEVARRAGIRASAIRYYESAGLLEAPRRVSGRRVYEADVLDALRLVQLAKAAGFTMAEIQRLRHGFDRSTPASARWQALARRKRRDVTALIERAHRMQVVLDALLTCRCVSLAECVQPAGPIRLRSVRKRATDAERAT